MTVQVQPIIANFTANGSTTVFPYTFYLIELNDLEVNLNNVKQTSGYTVSGLKNPTGGNVTFTTAPAAGTNVLLIRKLPLQRLIDYQTTGDFLSSTVNIDYDRLWQALQQIAQSILSAIKLPFTNTTDQIINQAPADRANKVLSFDSQGNLALKELDDTKSFMEKVEEINKIGITEPQFDNSTKRASTEWVRRQGLQASNLFLLAGGNQTLNATHWGATLIHNASTAVTWTLPPANSAPAGARIEIMSQVTPMLTINTNGSDVIYGQKRAPAQTNVASSNILMLIGDSFTLATDGTTNWFVVGERVRASSTIMRKDDGNAVYTNGAATTKLTFGYIDLDEMGIFDYGNSSFKINRDGVYRIASGCFVKFVPAGYMVFLVIIVTSLNGRSIGRRGNQIPSAGGDIVVMFDRTMELVIGDSVEFFINVAGGSANLEVGGQGATYAEIHYLGR